MAARIDNTAILRLVFSQLYTAFNATMLVLGPDEDETDTALPILRVQHVDCEPAQRQKDDSTDLAHVSIVCTLSIPSATAYANIYAPTQLGQSVAASLDQTRLAEGNAAGDHELVTDRATSKQIPGKPPAAVITATGRAQRVSGTSLSPLT